MTSGQPSRFKPDKPRRILLLAVVGLAVLAAYRNTLTAPFVLDDGGSVTENATIRRLWPPWTALHPPSGGLTVSGRPVMNLSLALNYALSGDTEWSYHLLNTAIHLLAGLTLFGVVRRTLRRPIFHGRFTGAEDALAASIAACWLLHPLQTEAVTYVSQRTESLAGFFYLLTFYAFVRSCGSYRPHVWRAIAVGACLLGTGTKEILVTAPVLLLLFDRTFFAGTFRRAWAERRGFYLALAATWLPLLAFVASTGANRGGTAGFNVGVSPGSYWLTQCDALTAYLRLSLWPCPLVFDHGTFGMTLRTAWPYLLVVAPLVGAVLVALWRWPVFGFLGAWFFGILAPTSVVPGTIQMIVEHRMYLSLAAVTALLVAGSYVWLGRRSLWAWTAVAIAAAGLTHARNRAYASEYALWLDTVQKAPGNARAWYTLGIAASNRGEYADAVQDGEAALAASRAPAYAAKAYIYHNKLAHDLVVLGRMDEALAHYEAALRLNPEYAIAHLNLARTLVQLGRTGEALPHFAIASARHFGGATTEVELSDALMHAGQPTEAASHLQAALALLPDWAPGYNNLGYAYLRSGRASDAVAAYRTAVRLDPRYTAAWLGLGYALIEEGHPADAVPACAQAVALQPRSADAQNVLGIAFARSGRPTDAVRSFETSLKLNADAADVHNNLGNALASLGRSADAIAEYREALRLDPTYAPAQQNLEEEVQRGRQSGGTGR